MSDDMFGKTPQQSTSANFDGVKVTAPAPEASTYNLTPTSPIILGESSPVEFKIGFGSKPASNDEIVKEAVAKLHALGVDSLQALKERAVRLNGPASLPVAAALTSELHQLDVAEIAVFDPKLNDYVVSYQKGQAGAEPSTSEATYNIVSSPTQNPKEIKLTGSFGVPAQNTEIVKDVEKAVKALDVKGKIVYFTGPASLPAAVKLTTELIKAGADAINVFDPKMGTYICADSIDRYEVGTKSNPTE